MENRFDSHYWDNRYEQGDFPWDLGKPSRPLVEYLEKWKEPDTRILIPGAGNAYDAVWLHNRGFRQVHLLDWSEKVTEHFKKQNPGFPSSHVHAEDFFEHQGQYDLILEQTFYCALEPVLRDVYVKKMQELLRPGGILAGVWFDFPLTEKGPPFGGSSEEYRSRFSGAFEILQLSRCENSEAPRAGKELFIELKRK